MVSVVNAAVGISVIWPPAPEIPTGAVMAVSYTHLTLPTNREV